MTLIQVTETIRMACGSALQSYFGLLISTAVQNERDTISKRPRGEDTDSRHGLTTSVLLSAEILSRPASSPPGKYGFVVQCQCFS